MQWVADVNAGVDLEPPPHPSAPPSAEWAMCRNVNTWRWAGFAVVARRLLAPDWPMRSRCPDGAHPLGRGVFLFLLSSSLSLCLSSCFYSLLPPSFPFFTFALPSFHSSLLLLFSLPSSLSFSYPNLLLPSVLHSFLSLILLHFLPPSIISFLSSFFLPSFTSPTITGCYSLHLLPLLHLPPSSSSLGHHWPPPAVQWHHRRPAGGRHGGGGGAAPVTCGGAHKVIRLIL